MISILTPTYNRGYTLQRLYESLLSQSSKAFEWVVVDDGSTDGTEELVASWQEESPFPIVYISQPNRGKMQALNKGVPVTAYPYIFVVDSDDALTADAVETICNNMEQNRGEKKGYIYRRAYFDGHIIGSMPEARVLILHPTEAARELHGDLAYIFPRNAMIDHPFPEIEGEKFVPELYIWNMIGDKISFVCYTHKAIYLCEYLQDGYSKNFKQNFKTNPKGFLLFYKDQFFREKNILKRIKIAIRVVQGYLYSYLKSLKGNI